MKTDKPVKFKRSTWFYFFLISGFNVLLASWVAYQPLRLLKYYEFLYVPVLFVSLYGFILVFLVLNAVPFRVVKRLNLKMSGAPTLETLLAWPFTIFSFLLHDSFKVRMAKVYGAKIGKNVKISWGTPVIDPQHLEIGDNTLIGGFTFITPHLEEKGRYIVEKIRIGSNCVIGGSCFISPGVVIEDNVVVGAKSFVPKNKVLPKNTVWGGVPVKKLKG